MVFFCVTFFESLAIRYSARPETEAVTLLERFKIALFQGGDCFCLGHLLSDESMTSSVYTKKPNRDDFLNRLCIVFCDTAVFVY